MRLKKFIGLLLSIIMTVSSGSISFAENKEENNIFTNEYVSSGAAVENADGEISLADINAGMPEAGADKFIIPLEKPMPKAGANGFIAPISEPDPKATIIRTPEELANIKRDGNYVLGNDIDLSTYNGGVWTPINVGCTLDGQGHKIINLSIPESSNIEYAGLFGKIEKEDVTIKNVGIEGSCIFGKRCVGGLVAYGCNEIGYGNCSIIIENCYNSVNVINYSDYNTYGGGFVGDCGDTGKFIGTFDNIIIKNSYNSGNITSYTGGGLVGRGRSSQTTIENSYNSGNVTSYTGGGLVGSYKYKITIKNSYNGGNIIDTCTGGGIIGASDVADIIIENSYNNGNVTSISNSGNRNRYNGGLIGSFENGNSSDYYNIIIKNSYNSGDITSSSGDSDRFQESDNFSGGLLGRYKVGYYSYSGYCNGYGILIENSYNSGNITSSVGHSDLDSSANNSSCSGGLLGYCNSERGIFNCTIENSYNSGDVTSSVGKSSRICSNTASSGGLAGSIDINNIYVNTTMENCSSYGKINATSETENIYRGGLVGYCYKLQINGKYYYADGDGICGYKYAEITYGKPTTGVLYRESEEKNSLVINNTAKISASSKGKDALNVSWSSSKDGIIEISNTSKETSGSAHKYYADIKALKEGSTVLTASAGAGNSVSFIINVGNDYTIYVYESPGLENIYEETHKPVSNAAVEINGTSHTTDENGKVTFAYNEILSENSKYSISCEGYFPTESNKVFTPGKTYSFFLKSKGNDIYFKTARAIIDSKYHDLLADKGVTYIPLMAGDKVNTEKYSVYAEVDWNKYKEGEVYLQGEKSGKKYVLKQHDDNVAFAEIFDAGEPIKIGAVTKDSNKKEVKVEKTIPVKVKLIDVSLKVPDTEDIKIDGLYFLEDLGIKLSLGDLAKVASSISYENGKIRLVFGRNEDSEKKEIEMFNGLFTGKSGPSVSINGTVQIPITDIKNGEWSGGVTVSTAASSANLEYATTNMKDSEEKHKALQKIFKKDFQFWPYGIPCYIETSLSVGGSGSLRLYGPYDKVYFEGGLQGNGNATIGGGIGSGIDINGDGNDDISAKGGFEGGLNVTIPAKYKAEGLNNTSVDFDPSIEGNISGKIILKASKVDLGKQIQLGGFKWNKNGFAWKPSDLDTVSLADLDEENGWQIISRDYMKNGGGFGNNNVSLVYNSNERLSQKVYENIIESANANITYIDGVPYLIFTADNTNRSEENSMTAAYTAFNNGIWSEPVWIDDDGSLDTDVSADGKFAAWENSNKQFSADSEQKNLDDNFMNTVLSANEIEVGVWNGSGYDTTQLTNNDTYDFGVKVKSNGDKAIAVWLNNDENDFMSTKGITSVCCSIYDGVNWSEVKTISNVGKVTNLNVIFNGSVGTIIYKKSGRLYVASTDNNTEKEILSGIGRYAAADVNNKRLIAYFDENKYMHINIDGRETTKFETEFKGSENPVIASFEDTAYVFWIENDGIYYATNTEGQWSGRLCLETIDNVSLAGLSCSVKDKENYILSYFCEKDGITNLMTISASAGIDLSVGKAVFDNDIYTKEGKIEYTIPIYNNGEVTVNRAKINIYEDGECIYTNNVNDSILPGKLLEYKDFFYPDDRTVKHEYKIEVTAEGDYHSENNFNTISIGTLDGKIQDAYFIKNIGNKEKLYVVIGNNGSVNIDKAVVRIHKDSIDNPPVHEEVFENLSVGTMLSAEFEEAQTENTIYYITLEVEGDENEYNNTEIIGCDRTAPYETDIKDVKFGDIDCSGTVTVNDASCVLQKVLNSGYKLPIEEKTEDYMKYADVDGNNKLTASDASIILQKVLKDDFIMPVEVKN